MREKYLQAEKMINIKGYSLDRITNMKLDLQLLENRRRRRYPVTEPENKPLKPATSKLPKIAVKVNSVKAKATLRHVNID